ncbi:dUTP diphosphatase [Oceanobacillus kimchii]|uniref:dUTP diphosphatase n=1 Tax=Oceanobacillus kimchii TaxID=746691 RepID=UPI00232D6A75|nr:dUTP diphosphatase [Oceanobacillus kimchii]
MNLNKLMTIQADLDKHIEVKKGLQGQDLLDKKILALQVELGELANEWRGFKFWKENPEPRTKHFKGCDNCIGGVSKNSPLLGPYSECEFCKSNPLLEEYVDCLHFILSIGLELELDDRPNSLIYEIEEEPDELVLMFEEVLSHTCDLFWDCYHENDYEAQEYKYKAIFSNFLKLGDMLGFTTEQIEQAYLDKNKVNHARQESGY